MRKWIKVLLVLVILLIVAVAVVSFSIDGIAKRQVESAATTTLGVDTSLDSLSLGILRGSVKLHNLEVRNPAGYTAEHFFEMKDGRLIVSLGTLMGDKVVAPTLELSDLTINLEKKGGKANYEVITDHLKKQDTQDPNAQAGKKFVIDDVTIRNIKVHAQMMPLGGKLTALDLVIPEIHVKNVGSAGDNGVAMQEVTNLVMKAVLTAIAKKAGGILPAEMLSDLSDQLDKLDAVPVEVIGDVSKAAGQVVEGVVGELGKSIEGIGNIGKDGKSGENPINKVGEDAGKAIDDIGKGIFGDKKKK